MKHIVKDREPQSIKDLRKTPGSSYNAPQKEWQEQLLVEQGGICAYCMRRISLDRYMGKPNIQLEHYLSRERFPEKSLEWSNILGVCTGNFGVQNHCDQTDTVKRSDGSTIRGKIYGDVILEFINPQKKSESEDALQFSISGEIIPKRPKAEIQDDIDRLNLNDEKIIQARRDVIDSAKNRLRENYPNGQWTVRDFDKEIEYWESTDEDGNYKPFFLAAVHFLLFLKSRPKYS